jgi:hypothetical protein
MECVDNSDLLHAEEAASWPNSFTFTTKHMGNGKQAAWPRKGACTAGIKVVFSVISELSMNF